MKIIKEKIKKFLLVIVILLFISITVFIICYFLMKVNNNNSKIETKIGELEKLKDKVIIDENVNSTEDEGDDNEDSDDKSSSIQKVEGINNDRIYEDHFSLPYEDMQFADEEVFEIIKNSYDRVNFFGEFKRGNLEVYNYYKEKFYQLLSNKEPFTYNDKAHFSYPQKERTLYLNEFRWLNTFDDTVKRDLKVNKYYFFDMDEDGTPELCISNPVHNIGIFKYLKDVDKFVLWYEIPTSYLQLSGSKKVRWSGDGENQLFYNLNDDGVEECTVFFFCIPKYNKIKEGFDEIYIAGLPYYGDGEESIKVSDNIKRQGYFSKDKQMYFYRLKEDQYVQLEKKFYKAENQAIEKLEEVTYTYEELFGKYN